MKVALFFLFSFFFFQRELTAQGPHLVDRGAGSVRCYGYSDTDRRQRHAGTYTNTEEHAHVLSCTRTVIGGLGVPDIHYTFRQISSSG